MIENIKNAMDLVLGRTNNNWTCVGVLSSLKLGYMDRLDKFHSFLFWFCALYTNSFCMFCVHVAIKQHEIQTSMQQTNQFYSFRYRIQRNLQRFDWDRFINLCLDLKMFFLTFSSSIFNLCDALRECIFV